MTDVFRELRARVSKLVRGRKTRDDLHAFWRRPDEANQPDGYLKGAERSELLCAIVSRYVPRDARILEVGCNAGRNLQHLRSNGFTQLAGIEINADAVALLRRQFPALAQHARLLNEPVETAITRFRDGEFDLVYTMAVLEHIHPDSDWIFPEMARVTRNVLVTIEDERGISWRHFPRNYSEIFGALGFAERETLDCSAIPGLGADFRARVFLKTS